MMKKPLLFFVFISLIFLSFTSCSKKQSPQELEDKVKQLMGLESAKELPIQEAEAVSIPSTKELIEEHKKKSSNKNEDNSKIDLDKNVCNNDLHNRIRYAYYARGIPKQKHKSKRLFLCIHKRTYR